MAIDQKANLKRMKEIIEQLKAMQEDKNAPDIDKVVPNEKDTSKLKTELQNIVNKETILYSDLDRIKEIVRLLSVTPKDKKIKKLSAELEKLGHKKYELSSEYIKKLNDSNYYPACSIPDVLDRARKDAMEALKFAVGEKMLDRALWIIREDGYTVKNFGILMRKTSGMARCGGMHCPDFMGRCCKNENCRRMM